MSPEQAAKIAATVYGCWNRAIEPGTPYAWAMALEDVTPYQGEKAMRYYTRNRTKEHPPDAATFRAKALGYDRTADLERRRIEHNRREQKRLEQA